MSDSLLVPATQNDAPSESIEQSSKEHSEKLQTLGRQVVASLYMLLRSVKMYDPDNSIFAKPLQQLLEAMNLIVRREGKLDFLGIRQSFYLNGMMVKVDHSALDNVKYLLDEMRAKDVGGFVTQRTISIDELKRFVWIFSKDQPDNADEDGVNGKKLISMKLAKWSLLKTRLEGRADDNEAKLDRKKYSFICYGRAVFFVRRYLESVRDGKPINSNKSLRIIQDIVDLCADHRTHFLGMSTTRVDQDYLVYHQVNTCLLVIVFGQELGLTKPQLRDLGYVALFHDAGMVATPTALRTKQGALTEEERNLVAKAPLLTVRSILRERTINRATLLRLVTTFEHKVDFGTAVRDSQGNIQMIIPRANLGLYAKLISICATYDALSSRRPYREAYGPEVALMLMWTEMRNKFDPELLRVFMRVMAIAPIKVLTKRQHNLTLGLV